MGQVTLDFSVTPWWGLRDPSQVMKMALFRPYAFYNSRMSNPVSSPEKATSSKRPVGRPTAYRPEMCEQLIEAMAGGHSAEAGAAKISISARSLFEWQKLHPEFLMAIQEGRHRAVLFWESLAIDVARGKSGNSQMITLALKKETGRPAAGTMTFRRPNSLAPMVGPFRQR